MASATCCLVHPVGIRASLRTQSTVQRPLSQRICSSRSNMRSAARAEGKVTREYSEEDGSVKDSAKKPLYADELPPPREKSMSREQQQKLRDEYLGLGGSANNPIPNYFLYIIIGISFLAVLSWLSGAV